MFLQKKRFFLIGVITIFLLLTVAGTFAWYFWTLEKISNNNHLSSLSLAMAIRRHAQKEQEIESEKTLPFYEVLRQKFLLSTRDFLEINLQKMSIRVFKSGILIKEVKILKQGDEKNWGGTAVGLYKIIRGFPSAYSVISNVYMPWTLHFYGKYYVHGEPYYSDGSPLISEFSGGCIRLKNADAKIIYELTEKNMPVIVIDKEKDGYEYTEEQVTPFPEISAKSFLVADIDSGFIFAKKNSNMVWPMASLTKLMTAIVIAENVELNKTITVSEKMLEPYGSTENIEEGDIFRAIELFYPLLIESSNDSGEILSHFLGKERMLTLMDEKAKAIMMEQTKFADSFGYDPENTSTAQDIFYLARYISNNRSPIWDITKSKQVRSFGSVSFDIENLWNKNVFINDPTFIGGKTGYIIDSRYNAVFVFKLTTYDDAERRIAIITLGSENEELDSQKIYSWLIKNYFPNTKT